MQLVATVLDSTILESYHIYIYHIYFSSKRRSWYEQSVPGTESKGKDGLK